MLVSTMSFVTKLMKLTYSPGVADILSYICLPSQYCCKQLTAKCLHLGESEVGRYCRTFCKVTNWLVLKQNCRLHLPSGFDSSLYRRTTGEFSLLFQNWLLGDVPLLYFAITQWEIPDQPFFHFSTIIRWCGYFIRSAAIRIKMFLFVDFLCCWILWEPPAMVYGVTKWLWCSLTYVLIISSFLFRKSFSIYWDHKLDLKANFCWVGFSQ